MFWGIKNKATEYRSEGRGEKSKDAKRESKFAAELVDI